MAGIGLVCGLLYSFGGLLIDLITTGPNRGTLLAFGAIIGMPVVFGAFGFVLGVVIAALVTAIRMALRRRR